MKTIIAVLFCFLALNSWGQVTGGSPTNTAPPGATNTSPATPGSGQGTPISTAPQEVIWLENATPPGAALSASPDEPWDWTNAFWNGSGLVSLAPGSLVHLSPLAAGWHQHYFGLLGLNLAVNAGGSLFADIYLPWTNAPSAVALRWLVGVTNGTASGSWVHGAYWCASSLGANGAGTNAVYGGALPPAGQWARLSVPADAVGLGGQFVQGISFAICNGAAAWGAAGEVVPAPGPNGPGAAGAGSMSGPGPLQAGSCAGPFPALAGWWQGEDNANDQLGWYPGLWAGTPGYASGKVNQAFELNNPTGPDPAAPITSTSPLPTSMSARPASPSSAGFIPGTSPTNTPSPNGTTAPRSA